MNSFNNQLPFPDKPLPSPNNNNFIADDNHFQNFNSNSPLPPVPSPPNTFNDYSNENIGYQNYNQPSNSLSASSPLMNQNYENAQNNLPPVPHPPLSYSQQNGNEFLNMPPIPPTNNYMTQSYDNIIIQEIPKQSLPPIPKPPNQYTNEQTNYENPNLYNQQYSNNLPAIPNQYKSNNSIENQFNSSPQILSNSYQNSSYNENAGISLNKKSYSENKSIQSSSPVHSKPVKSYKKDNVAVIHLDKQKKEKQSNSNIFSNNDEDQVVDDPRLIKVKDYKETIPEIKYSELPDYKIHFINLPKPIMSPIAHITPFNSGSAPVFPNDYNQILKNCIATKIPFVDKSFPSDPVHDKCGEYTVTWNRIKDMDPFAIFTSPGGVISSDTIQGGCADSPLISVVSAIASKPKLFKKVVPNQEWNKSTTATGDNNNNEDSTDIFENIYYSNIFKFNFWKWGKWVEVIVDDRLPYLGENLAFSTCRNKSEYWFPLLEKAYAKLHGSYQAIEFCSIDNIILDLTGGSCEIIDLRFNNNYSNIDFFYKYLQECMKKKFILFPYIECAERQSGSRYLVQPNGLLLGRPYYITGFSSVKLGKKSSSPQYQLVKLFSPWDNETYKGSWGPNSSEISKFSDKNKKKKNLTFGKLEFWINISDVYKEFTHLYVAKPQDILKKKKLFKIISIWDCDSAGGCPKYTSWTKNPQFLINISQNTDIIHISLVQQDWKIFIRDSKQTEEKIGFVVFKVEDNRTVKIHRIINVLLISEFENRREVSAHINISKGRYIVMPCTYKPKKQMFFYIRIWTEKNIFSCKEIKRAIPKKKLFANKPNGVLTIEVVKAKGLRKVGILSCDPYAEITVEGNCKKTRSASDTTNPEWRQQFIFFLNKPNKAVIKIEVWHNGIITSTFLGTAKVNISELIDQVNGATYRTSVALKSRKKDEKQSKETITGFIVLRLNYFGDIKNC